MDSTFYWELTAKLEERKDEIEAIPPKDRDDKIFDEYCMIFAMLGQLYEYTPKL